MKRLYVLLLFILSGFMLTACGSKNDSSLVETATPIPPSPTATATAVVMPTPFLPTATPLPTRETENPLVNDTSEKAEINDWLQWFPPSGWEEVAGTNSIYISPQPFSNGSPFMMVARWRSPVPIDGWANYLPNAVPEINGRVTLTIDNIEWDGVFVICPDFSCRAFFAATRSGSNHYTILVYLPVTNILISDNSDESGELYQLWDEYAVELNRTLQTMRLQ